MEVKRRVKLIIIRYKKLNLLNYFRYNSGELLKNTATSAFVSGTVGAVVGGGMYGLSSNVGGETTKTLGQTIIADSTSSAARKGMGQIERNILSFFNNLLKVPRKD